MLDLELHFTKMIADCTHGFHPPFKFDQFLNAVKVADASWEIGDSEGKVGRGGRGGEMTA